MEMDMETHEDQSEFMGSTDNHSSHVTTKGKRTKRPRPASPSGGGAVVTSTSSTTSVEDDQNYYDSTTEEEEDMANCLILLAQGGGGGGSASSVKRMTKFNTTTITANPKFSETGVYECKTCNKVFHSFQALGGHRASHKKPKTSMLSNTAPEEEKKIEDVQLQFINNKDIFVSTINSTSTMSLQVSSSSAASNYKSSLPASSKVHECSICGSEFSSGQALGGHMRRHRAAPTNNNTNNNNNNITMSTTEKPRSILALDLNLPAPEEDDHHFRDAKFHQFATNQKRPFVFSAPALVDCHY